MLSKSRTFKGSAGWLRCFFRRNRDLFDKVKHIIDKEKQLLGGNQKPLDEEDGRSQGDDQQSSAYLHKILQK